MIELNQFCYDHDLSIETLRVAKSNGFHKEAYTKVGSKVYVDETYFIRRKEWRLKAQMFSHSMYYYLSEYFSDAEIARNASPTIEQAPSYTIFINNSMFHNHQRGITNTKMSTQEWMFYRYCCKINRKIKKRYPNFDVELFLDRRAGIC